MKKIKELRKQLGVSQNELAKQLNVAQNTISRWESGERAVDADSLKKLAEFFGVSTDYLLELESAEISDIHSRFTPTNNSPIRLKELRVKCGMSQKDLAYKIGHGQSTISQWENGTRIMDAATLKYVAGFFNVSTDYLLGISSQNNDSPSHQEKYINDKMISDNKKALLDFAETVPEDKAVMILQVMKSIVEAD